MGSRGSDAEAGTAGSVGTVTATAAATRSGPGDTPEGERTGVSPELLERLRPYLAESLMVLDAEWTITANLAPPGGLIGRGLGLGVHTLEDMHPDDAVQVLELGAQAFSTHPGWQGSKVVRMRTGDGRYGLYEITAVNRFDDPVIAGMVVRTRELPRDVADNWPGIQARSAVETLAEVLPIAVLMLDVRGRIIFANAAACEMLDSTPEALKRDGLQPVVATRDHPLIDDALRVISATPAREQCLVRLAGADATLVECRFSSEGFDEVTCVSLTMEDVTERHAAQRDLEQRANHDELTGLLNRAALLTLLETRLGNGTATTVAYVDLDGFKQVNDTWGHERGDQLLVAVADALRSGLAPPSVAARLGGDEFVVVVVATDGPAVARRIRSLVAAIADREELDLGCSVGTAIAQHGDAPVDVVRRADEAMYASRARC